jgi:sulfane dehydrogenase subunit SoxC
MDRSDRRRFLWQSAGLTVAGLTPSVARAAKEVADSAPSGPVPPDLIPPDLVPSWMKTQGQPILTPPYGEPSPHEAAVVRIPIPGRVNTTTAASLTPLQDMRGIITPNGLVFERHHGGVPDIPLEQHRLLVHGLVERPLTFTMADLMRLPSVSKMYFLECSGNTAGEWSGLGKTVQITHGLLSCCEWTGVPLAVALQEAGVEPRAKWLLAEGADAAAMTRSIPMEKALDDALLVYAQNGEMLRPEQGYPLRLFLPGFEGNMSVKWLRRIKLGTTPFMTREETSKYTDLMPDGTARQFTYLMEAKSVILRPSGGQRMSGPGFVEIQGIAWSGRGRIVRVDVSVDGGRSWRPAQLDEPVLTKCLTAFRLPWRWDGAPAILQSRAVDESGYVQPNRDALIAARGVQSYYHNNSIQSWRVSADGQVQNVHA